MKKAIVVVTGLFALVVLLVLLTPGGNANYIKQGKLYINKILASNYSLYEDNEHEYHDLIEIYNGYDYQIKLNGYHLSDSEFEIDKWTFPDITINPKEHLIVYASGLDNCDIVKRVCHTNFKLSDKGETLTLTDKHGNIISKFTYPVQYTDVYYGFINNKYTYINGDGKSEYVAPKVNNYTLEITEYMTHNKRSHYDSYGNYFDFVEIHNNSGKDYKLEGLYISDDATNLKKYLIKETDLKKDEYLIIYLAGNSTNYEDGIYADFKLSDDDEYIVISNGEKIIDKVKIVPLVDDVSYGKVGNKWKYFTTPTPGKINNTKGFDNWGGNDETS